MEKKLKYGLVLGRFCPLHNGHKYLISEACRQCDVLYVMICSLMNEPINGFDRFLWLVHEYRSNKKIKIIWCQDENPQVPEECESVDEFYNKYWVPSVYSRIPKLDVVFTSENYGDEFARYLNVEHVLVDLERKVVPASGTKVRFNPYGEMWDYIPSCVKQYYLKKIVIMGPESTGKSTMTKKLSKYFKTKYVEEYGRYYTEYIKPASDLTVSDFEKIADRQFGEIHNKTKWNSDKLLFIDTEAITTKLFGELYIDGFKSQMIDTIIDHQNYDLYLLLDVDVPWVDDGTRDFPYPTQRKTHFNMIKNELERKNFPYVVISGNSYEDRFENAVKEIKKSLNI